MHHRACDFLALWPGSSGTSGDYGCRWGRPTGAERVGILHRGGRRWVQICQEGSCVGGCGLRGSINSRSRVSSCPVAGWWGGGGLSASGVEQGMLGQGVFSAERSLPLFLPPHSAPVAVSMSETLNRVPSLHAVGGLSGPFLVLKQLKVLRALCASYGCSGSQRRIGVGKKPRPVPWEALQLAEQLGGRWQP